MTGLRRIHEILAAAEQAKSVTDEHKRTARRVIDAQAGGGDGQGGDTAAAGDQPAAGGR